MSIRNKNFIKNPSFEVNVSDETFLESSFSSGSAPTISQDLTTYAKGSASLKCAITTAPDAEEWRVKIRMNNTAKLALTIGHTYTFSVYVKTSDAGNIKLAVENDAGSFGYYGSSVPSTTGFVRYSVTFTASATQSDLGPRVICNTGVANRQVYVDGAQFEEAATASTYFDGSLTVPPYLSSWEGTAHNSISDQATAPAALSVWISNVDRTNQIEWETIQVTQILTKQSDQLVFRIKNYGTKTYIPAVGNEIGYFNSETKVFGGNIIQINQSNSGMALYNEIVVKDYSHLLDSQLVSKTYTSQTISAIISDLLSSFTDGTFTMVNVSATTTIPLITFNYITVSECLKKLVSLLSGYDWYVDYTKDIHFFAVATQLAAFNLTDNSQNYLFNSLNIRQDLSQLANEIVIEGGKTTGSTTRTEYLNGDTTRNNYPLGNDFSAAPVVVVGGVTKTVGIDGVDSDLSFQSMWNQNSQLIRFTTGNTPASGTNNITVTGYPRFPLTYIKQSQTSITTYGRKQKVLIDKTITDLNAASLRAAAELSAYSNPVGSATFTTYTAGLAVGQYINITSSIRNINQNYKIQAIKTKARTPTTLYYDIELQVTNNLTLNDVLAKLLVTDPASANDLSANTVIARVFSFGETLTVTDTIHAPTKTSPPYVWDTMLWNLFTWG